VEWICADPKGAALLIGVDGQAYGWDGKSDTLTAGALVVDNSAVKKADQLAQEKEATPEQFREFIALQKTVSADQFGDVMEAGKERQAAEHWTNRQRLAWEIEELKKAPATRPAASGTGDFGALILQGIRFYSPTSGVALTSDGILITDGSSDRWKAVTAWNGPADPFAHMIGGSEKALYVLGSNFTIWRWTAKEGVTEIRKIPGGIPYPSTPAACAFANEDVGAFASGRSLMVTQNGGKNWVETPLVLDKPGEKTIMELAFCGPDALVVASGTESIAFLKLDKDGQAHEQWRSPIFGRFGNGFVGWPNPAVAFDATNQFIWVYSDSPNGRGRRMQGFALADGKVVREFEPFTREETLVSYTIQDKRMYTFGIVAGSARLLRMWDLGGEKPARIHDIQYENQGHNFDAVYAVPGTDELWIVQDHQRLVQWNGKPEMPMFLTSSIRRATVDRSVFDSAKPRGADSDKPR
jgi:hypothetical protein